MALIFIVFIPDANLSYGLSRSLMFQAIAGFRKIRRASSCRPLKSAYQFNSALLSCEDGLVSSIHQPAPTSQLVNASHDKKEKHGGNDSYCRYANPVIWFSDENMNNDLDQWNRDKIAEQGVPAKHYHLTAEYRSAVEVQRARVKQRQAGYGAEHLHDIDLAHEITAQAIQSVQT